MTNKKWAPAIHDREHARVLAEFHSALAELRHIAGEAVQRSRAVRAHARELIALHGLRARTRDNAERQRAD